MTNTARVAVLGAGAWGLALADHAARQGNSVSVWDRSPDVLESLRKTATIDRPSGLVVHETVRYHDTIQEAVEAADYILSVIPSYATAKICHVLAPLKWSGNGAIFVNCSKGIDPDTLRLPWETFAAEIGTRDDLRYGVLAGPSHAEEVSRNQPTAVVASAINIEDATRMQHHFGSKLFRVYLQGDYRGVELGGALKNVMSIAAGISVGLGYGDNTNAALITRALVEITRLAVATGAKAETMAGLAGLGDLVVTTMSPHSRNRSFGELIASGHSPAAAMEKIGAVVEGYRTTNSVEMLSRRHQVEMPLVNTIYKVLYESMELSEAIEKLLERRPVDEN